MTCNSCNGATELVESTGGVKRGQFREEYRCINCGARGTVKGQAEDFSSWTRTGRVFSNV